MKAPLRILHLEDDPADAALIASTLAAGGVTAAITRVKKRDGIVAVLLQKLFYPSALAHKLRAVLDQPAPPM